MSKNSSRGKFLIFLSFLWLIKFLFYHAGSRKTHAMDSIISRKFCFLHLLLLLFSRDYFVTHYFPVKYSPREYYNIQFANWTTEGYGNPSAVWPDTTVVVGCWQTTLLASFCHSLLLHPLHSAQCYSSQSSRSVFTNSRYSPSFLLTTHCCWFAISPRNSFESIFSTIHHPYQIFLSRRFA